MRQRCYNGVFMLGSGPSMQNIERLDSSALPMLHYMSRRGIQIDPDHFAQMDVELTHEMERLESEVEQIAGHYVNVSSPPQIANLLFKELGLKQARIKLTESGDRESTDKDVLVAIQHEHIAVAKIVEYRKLDKLRGTYVRPIPKLARRSKFGQWRLYPNFKHTRVPTGRYAAADPNLLAMPNRTPQGRRMCEGFITDPGWVILSVDECLHPDTEVETLLGPKKMKDIQVGDKVYSYKDHRITWGAVTVSKAMKPKRAYRLTIDSGETVTASFDHKWPTQWAFTYPGRPEIVIRRTDELRVGERMVPCRKHQTSPTGYKTPYADRGSFASVQVHTLVAEAFLGPRPPHHHIHHKEECKTNNHPSNLEYKLNTRHTSDHAKVNYPKQDHVKRIAALRLGLAQRRTYEGTENPNAKLREGDYELILKWARAGMRYKTIAEFFEISMCYVQEIVTYNYTSENHRIVDIEEVGVQPMWGITVESDHNYVLSCGIVTQNSQIEPRSVAHRSQDRRLMHIYETKQDIYSDFAISSFKLPDGRFEDEKGWHYPSVHKKDHRFPAKTCILASIYRVTGAGLLEQMPVICSRCGIEAAAHSPEKCPKGFKALWNEDNCTDLVNSFYIQYPGIGHMQHIDDARARRFGYIWDDWGRLQHAAATRSIHPYIVSKALRELGNMPVQSFACGTLKLTMAAVQDDLVNSGMLGDVVHPILPVHDELLFECREDVAEELGSHVAWRFKTCVNLTVPLAAEYTWANSWGLISK